MEVVLDEDRVHLLHRSLDYGTRPAHPRLRRVGDSAEHEGHLGMESPSAGIGRGAFEEGVFVDPLNKELKSEGAGEAGRHRRLAGPGRPDQTDHRFRPAGPAGACCIDWARRR